MSTAPAAPVRVRLDLAYDGTDFHGWAPQPGLRTVAGVFTDALGRLLGPDGCGTPVVAGRTDAGVHASGQVCHLDVSADRWAAWRETLLHRLARLLPRDVRVAAVTPVAPEFHARFSALERRYRYRVTDALYAADPLRRRDTLAVERPLDPVRLQQAATGLVGEHDFAAYCRRKENGTTIRTLTRLDWHRDQTGVLVATVAADAFCQSMVRSLVGALLTVGAGQRPVEWPAQLLARSDRAGEVQVAPAHGLTLVSVTYPDSPEQWAARDRETRRLRDAPAPPTAADGTR